MIVTSDHGDELLDHGGIEHSRTYYEEMMRVPLVVRVPGRGQGREVEEQVGLIDVTPTVLDLLGIASGLPFQGRSLRPLIDGESLPERPVVGEASQDVGAKAVRTNRWKYVREAGGAERLYDLTADPREGVDACTAQAAACADLEGELRAWERETAAASARLGLPPPAPAAVDAATRERLRQMGYAD